MREFYFFLKSPYLDNGLVPFHMFLRVGYMYTLDKWFSKKTNQTRSRTYTTTPSILCIAKILWKNFQTLNPKSKNLNPKLRGSYQNQRIGQHWFQTKLVKSDSSADSTPKKKWNLKSSSRLGS